MCNHYRIKESERVIEFARTAAESLGNPWEVKNSAWPGAEMPVVIHQGQRILQSMRWGVWPFYEKEPTNIVNARDDSLTRLALWKESAKKRRCLIPLDGFYEWAGPKGSKFEVLIRFHDNRPFWIAGIWSDDPVGGGRGYSMVTTKPNDLLAAIPHERMLVILDNEAAMKWIGSSPMEPEEILSFCKPYPSTELVREDMPKPERKATSSKKKPKAPTDIAELGL